MTAYRFGDEPFFLQSTRCWQCRDVRLGSISNGSILSSRRGNLPDLGPKPKGLCTGLRRRRRRQLLVVVGRGWWSGVTGALFVGAGLPFQGSQLVDNANLTTNSQRPTPTNGTNGSNAFPNKQAKGRAVSKDNKLDSGSFEYVQNIRTAFLGRQWLTSVSNAS